MLRRGPRRLSSLLHPALSDTVAAGSDVAGISSCLHSRVGWVTWNASAGIGGLGTRSTTVLSVRKGNEVIIMADGQVTRGNEVVKPNVRKVRSLIEGKVIGGFAGATADAFTLFDALEMKLEAHQGQLTRAAVELAKLWRTDKYLRRLDAVMVVADKKQSLTITGNGDVLEPNDGIIAIGSGGPYALAAARALADLPEWNAAAIAEKAMKIAADSCIYTNHNFTVEKIEAEAA